MTKCQQFFVKASEKIHNKVSKNRKEKLIFFNEEIHYSIPILTGEKMFIIFHMFVTVAKQMKIILKFLPSIRNMKKMNEILLQ